MPEEQYYECLNRLLEVESAYVMNLGIRLSDLEYTYLDKKSVATQIWRVAVEHFIHLLFWKYGVLFWVCYFWKLKKKW